MENYEVLLSVGKGLYGSVDLVKDLRDNRKYALKKIECSNETTANKAMKELILLNCPKYPFIQKCREVFVSWDVKNFSVFLCIVAEYFEKGSMKKALTARNPFETEMFMKRIGQLLEAVIRLHGDGIIHRNIKPSNVYIRDDDSIALGDFGLVTLMSELEMKKGLKDKGDSIWTSPEALLSGIYEERSDIWSLGCLFLFMASCGHLIDEDKLTVSLYHMKTTPELLESLLETIRNACGEQLSSLFRSMIRNSVHQRPTALELCDNPYMMECLHAINSDFNPKLQFSTDEHDAILGKLLKSRKSIDTQECLLKELLELAQNNKELVLKPATFNYIIEILCHNCSHRNIQVLGLMTLHSTNHGEHVRHVDPSFLCKVIMDSIKEHNQDSDLLVVATQLLMELCTDSQEARGCVIESGSVVVLLLNAVKYSAVGLDLLISFSILLMTLITDDHMSNVVVANGVIEVMADSLQSDIGNIELINAVLPVIAYFSLSENNLSFILGSGVPGLLIDIMQQHQKETTILKFSTFTLHSICAIQDDCIYYIVDPESNCKGGLKCILNTLRMHSNDSAILASITKFLQTMSKKDDIMYELSILEVTVTLSLVLQQLHDNEIARKQLQLLIALFLDE